MIKIDKSTIKNFAESKNDETALLGLNFATSLIENALSDIANRNPYVPANSEIFPVGAFFSGTVLPSSTIELFVVISSPQIELNTHKLFKNKWKNFKERLKYAWKNRKKKKRKKKKKGSEVAPEVNLYETHKEDYNLAYFTRDFVHALAKEITQDDIVFSSGGVIIVQGKNVPYRIKIRPVIKKEDGKFLFYAPNKKALQEYNFDSYFENIEALVNQDFAEKFIELVLVFKGLYEHLMQDATKGFFIESLVANLPYSAFESDDVFENFVFSANYLINQQINKLFSIASPDKQIFKDELCQIGYADINKFFLKLVQGL